MNKPCHADKNRNFMKIVAGKTIIRDKISSITVISNLVRPLQALLLNLFLTYPSLYYEPLKINLRIKVNHAHFDGVKIKNVSWS